MPATDLTLAVLLAISAYSYFGYPLLLRLIASLKRKKFLRAEITPDVTVLLIARNEVGRLRERVKNILEQDYPPDKLALAVASDGSDDGTAKLITELEREDARIKGFVFAKNRGKAPVINDVVPQLVSEIVFFADARQKWRKDFVRTITGNFADRTVGAVSGELVLEEEGSEGQTTVGLYWRYEKWIRKNESATGQVTGATGAGYAIRRKLFRRIPDNALIEDVVLPLEIMADGKAVLFDERAIALDRLSRTGTAEFRRKLRTLAGNYQILCHPFRMGRWYKNPFRFLSHKASRLFVPWMMLTTLPLCFISTGGWALPIGAIEALFLLMGALGLLFPSLRKKSVAFNFPAGFCILNVAALCSAFVCLTGIRTAAWR